MMNEKKVPQIRFSGFIDEWADKFFSEIFEERHEYSTITEEYPQLSFTIAEGVIRPEDRKTNKRDFLIIDKDNKQYLKTEVGDIIYNPANVIWGAIHRNNLCKGVVSPIYKIFITNQDSIFLEGVVRNEKFIKKMTKHMEGTVQKLKTLKPESFLNMNEYIPNSLVEQQKIGTMLSKIDSLIQAKTQKLERIKAVKKSLLQKCFPKDGETVPQMRFETKNEWNSIKFEECFTFLTNNSFSRDELNYEDGCIKNIHYGDILIKFDEVLDIKESKLPYVTSIKNEKEYSKSFLMNGDIIIADAAEDETVGKCTEIHNCSGNIASGLHTIAVRPKVKFATGFLGFCINSEAYHKQLIPLMQGTKVSSLSKTAIKDTIIYFPKSLTEQEKIGEFFSKYNELIKLNLNEIDKLITIKKSLLQKMFV